jgi:beta-lactamase regulating signal transducer with metallopeptidase domain
MIAWMVYAAVVGGLVAAGGLALERLSAAAGKPRRFAWMTALALAVVIPLAATVHAIRSAPPAQAASEATVADGIHPMAEARGKIVPALPLLPGRESARAAATVWGAGSIAALAILCTVLLWIAWARRRWVRTRVDNADVYVSRRFGPALVGVTKPRVVVPSWVLGLSEGARAAIIRHEAEHARARDHLALLSAGIVVAAFPWNPAMWWMFRRLRAAIEFDCDERVIASGIAAKDYGDVLLDAGSRSFGRWGLAPAMSHPTSLLERRLRTMSDKPTKTSGARAALLAGAAMVALAVACDTPVPTEVRRAFEDAEAEARDRQGGEEPVSRADQLLLTRLNGADIAPLIYVDGVRVNPSEAGGETPGFLEAINPDNIDRIEVLKGPAAKERYGEEAAGGVIQIFIKGIPLLQMSRETLLPSTLMEAYRAKKTRAAERLSVPVEVALPSMDIRVVGPDTLVAAKRRN